MYVGSLKGFAPVFAGSEFIFNNKYYDGGHAWMHAYMVCCSFVCLDHPTPPAYAYDYKGEEIHMRVFTPVLHRFVLYQLDCCFY